MPRQAAQKAGKTAYDEDWQEQSSEIEENVLVEEKTAFGGISRHTLDLRMQKAREVKMAELIRREPWVKELLIENEQLRAELTRLAAK